VVAQNVGHEASETACDLLHPKPGLLALRYHPIAPDHDKPLGLAAENVGFFTAPYEVRAKLGRPVIDRANRAVHVTLSAVAFPESIGSRSHPLAIWPALTWDQGKDMHAQQALQGDRGYMNQRLPIPFRVFA
jgi:hypothetical protein